MERRALYIHFPYCLYKCHYCDFNSYAISDAAAFRPYLDGLVGELALRLKRGEAFPEGTPLKSIFLGGGTPSLLSPEELGMLLDKIRAVYPFSPFSEETEVTIECNPKTLTPEKLAGYFALGVNRISIGIQSFSDRYLAPLGRIHTGKEARETLALVAASPFAAVNTDLMFGFPGQSQTEVLEDLRMATDCGFSHLSWYALTPEPGTRFFRDLLADRVVMPEDDLARAMLDAGWDFLAGAGFCQYEVSNFYRAGRGAPSRHNLAYWDYAPFLGLGAGAVSFFYRDKEQPVFGRRQSNHRLPERYLAAVSAGALPYEEEAIDRDTALKEWLMMGLRKRTGVSLIDFDRKFPGVDFAARFGPIFERHLSAQLLSRSADGFYVTAPAFPLLDAILSPYF